MNVIDLNFAISRFFVCIGTTPSPTTGLSSCTFEDRRFCGFTQDTTDGFNWRWGFGQTSSTNTGPTNDHTYKTSAGHYMFTQGSTQPRGRKARLVSPIYLANTQPVCVKFWYNMYGTGLGTLNVYKKASGVLGQPIWSLSGRLQFMHFQYMPTFLFQSVNLLSSVFKELKYQKYLAKYNFYSFV